MVFRFTRAAQKKLKIGALAALAPAENLFYEWFVHVFHARRYRYFITTNAATLFTVIIPGAGVKDDSIYFDNIFDAIKLQMEDVSMEFIYRRLIATKTAEILLSTTNSKSILGSMNDMIFNAKFLLDHEKMSPFDAGRFINKTPFSGIGMDYPENRMKNMPIFK
jgi:hypothetical protein